MIVKTSLHFHQNEKTVYYTRSSRKNSLEYKLYKATLEEGSHGNWIKEELLDINKANVSIETPFLNRKGDKLYFSSNMPGSIGGYDIYVSNVNGRWFFRGSNKFRTCDKHNF